MKHQHKNKWLVLFSLALSSTLSYAGRPAFELLDMLASDNDQARAQARQLLPREDVRVVPKLVSLLSSDNDAVRLTAFNVLADFANQVSVPGRESDRDKVTASLMTLVAPQQPASLKEMGLRLLPLVAADAADLGPIAALLVDAQLQEKARAALVEMGTPGAAAVLCKHLEMAAPAFACAILDGLGQMRDAAIVDAIAAHLSSQHPVVRAAAARALSWTGNPAYLAATKRLVSVSDEGTQADAVDAWLRLVRAVETRGGNWQTVTAEYREMTRSDDPKVRVAGLVGLGRIGDGSCVESILACIQGSDGVEWAAGIEALEQMRGVDVCRGIVNAYSSAAGRMQLALLPVLGRKQHTLALGILNEAAAGSDPAFRTAALIALGESARPEAVETLRAACKSAEAREQATARAALVDLGDALRRGRHAGAAGGAYLAALTDAPPGNTELRHRALAGLTASPSPQAFEIARSSAEDPDMRDLALPLLINVGDKLVEAKDNDKALQLYQAAIDLKPDTATLRSLADKMMRLGSPIDWAAQLGIIRHWSLVGPFELGAQNAGWDKPYIDEPNVDLKARYMSGNRRLDWVQVVADERGVVNIAAALGQVDNAIGYAYAEIDVSAATDAVLRIGADDSEKVWLNGEQVFELWAARGLTIDQDKVPVKLKSGTNTILMKVWQNTLGWEFCVRVTTPDDQPIAFTQKTPDAR
jgi:HEAT repeat protein